jgi:hypothetical protein
LVFSLFDFIAMKRLAVQLLFILIYSTSSVITRAPEPLALFGIKVVIDKYFAENVHEVEIISFGIKNGKAERTIEKILRLSIQSIPIRVTRNARENLQSDEYKLKNPSILLFDSPENFNQTQQRIVFQSGSTSHPHLVYVPHATLNDVKVVSDKNHTIHKSIFLVNEMRESIELATAFMFTPDACYTNQFKVINRFTPKNKWENSNFFVEKYSNFYGCNVAEQNEIFKKILNYTDWQYFKSLPENPIWIAFAPLHYTLFSTHDTYVVMFDSQKIYIPPGEVHGDYEKMFLPFDAFTWIAIGMTIFMPVSAILVIKWISPNNQEIYFGRNNRSPLMNFISILLNGSQARTVAGNAPRIFFLTFIFWSLIFRLGFVDNLEC